jgi:bleomycin hydrolase
LEIPDNFLLRENYLNVPLKELIDIARQAIEKGSPLVVDMDVSNNGWNCSNSGYALFENSRFASVANPDTAEMEVSPELRQQLFETLVTQDDHLIHIVGIAKSKNGKLFFILKDSGGENYGPFKGYDYISENYFSINALSITLPVGSVDEKYLKMAKDDCVN